ncbi:hypothetical protein [Isoptericola aurantiacus]|uniref:hypothetical protein n=1 Tax=Isoptericola aurantiacus TaxID=3377839 RepID=UPI00383B670E
MHTTTAPAPTARHARRRRAFRVVSVVVALWLTAVVVFALTEVVLMWLPESTVTVITGDDVDLGGERLHYLAAGLLGWATLLPAYAQWRRPERRVASMQLLCVVAVGSFVVFGSTGDLGPALLEECAVLLPVLLLAALHPRARDVLTVGPFDRGPLVLALAGAAGWAAVAVAALVGQVEAGADGPHSQHRAAVAVLGVVLGAAALLGASRTDGRGLPAGIAVGATAVVAVHSLTFPGSASALGTTTAVLALLWAAAFAALTGRAASGVRRGQLGPGGGGGRASGAPGSTPA